MVVHIYGLPVDMDPILHLADQYGLAVIEDAAELIGGTYNDKVCGSFGTISTFSFYPNKHITTGEGGMVVTNDFALAERCRSLRNLCFQPKKRFVHDELGWNYRMTNLQAALGLAQLERLEEVLQRKREIGFIYQSLLSHHQSIALPIDHTNYALNLYWVFGVVLQHNQTPADVVMEHLAKAGIGTRPFFYPLHQQPVLLESGVLQQQSLPVSEHLAQSGFYLPSGIAITNHQINRSADALLEVINTL